MQISLRSHLIAGVAAAGATTLVLAPVATPQLAPAAERVSAAITLSALSNPVTAITETIAAIGNDFFGQAALPGPADLFWPDSYYTPDFSFLFSPDYVGIAPDLVNQFNSGALSGVINNLSGYANAGIYGITSLIGGISQAAFDLLTLDVAQALVDVQFAIGAVVQGVGYLVDNVIRNVTTLITNTVPGLVAKVIESTLSGGSILLGSLVETATAVITSLTTLDLEGAWNTAVDGLLGPNGTLGQIAALTVGIGIVQPVDYEEEGVVDTVVAPSVRSVLTSTFQRLGDLSEFGDGGIVNAPFEPLVTEPTASVAAPAAASARAAVEAAVEAPAAVTAADAANQAATEAAAEVPADIADGDVTRPVAGSSDAPAAEAAPETATAAVEDSAPARASAAVKSAGKVQASRGGRGGATSAEG